MGREVLRSPALYQPRFRYSPCVRTGPWYSVSGMVALDPDSGALVAGGPQAETRAILALLAAALPGWGLTLEHLASARVYTTRFESFPEINRAWEEFFETVEPPARTSVGVAALPLGASVEIDFSFYKEQ